MASQRMLIWARIAIGAVLIISAAVDGRCAGAGQGVPNRLRPTHLRPVRRT